jgi:hypothetical protein
VIIRSNIKKHMPPAVNNEQLEHLSKRLARATLLLNERAPQPPLLLVATDTRERVDAATRRLDDCERVLGMLVAVVGASSSF